jgi:N-methylhydantoinase B
MLSPSQIDPITLAIWWSRLVALTDEAATTLLRTAFSTIVRESNDFATVLMDSNGESIAEGSGGIPAFAGLIPRAVQAMLRKFPAHTWKPGDCVFTNDPWVGTGHLPDVTVAMPVFHRGRLVGFMGSAAHVPDIGGNPSPLTREFFEEGVFIPPMRLDRAGVRDDSVVELLLANVRLPELVLGDLEAQVSANRVGAQRALEFLESTGMASFDTLAPQLQQVAEAAMRRAITEIPDGTYSSRIEADGFEHQPTIIECAVTVTGDRMVVDYAGSSAQIERGTNCTLNYTRAYTVYPLKCALEPSSGRNAGTYRPIEILAPEGSILNARRPAAVGARHLTGHLLCCAVYQALAQVIPDRILADCGGSPALRVGFKGQQPDGRAFSQIIFASGGMGASLAADGLSTTAFPTNSGAGSIEALEAVAPLLIERKTYLADSGGPGRQRGGLGQECVVRNLAPKPIHLGVFGDRERHPALGVQGGGAGAPASATLESGAKVPLKSMSVLPAGAAVSILFPGGGGFGPASERSETALRADLDAGFVTAEGVARDYGRSAAALMESDSASHKPGPA